MPLEANSEIFVITPTDGCPATANLLILDASLANLMRVLRFEVSGLRRTATHRSDQYPPVRPIRCYCTSVFGSSVLALWLNQGT
jgi:hypothetical protein